MRRIISTFVLIILALAAFGQIPEVISFQGYMDGEDGDYTITFRIYDSSAGGSELWSEDHASVPVSDGIFSVMLGSVEELSALDFSEDYWLQVEIDGEVLSPRYEMGSSPYAFRAKFADNATFADFAGIATYADTALFAEEAAYADEAEYAEEADYAEEAGHAETADNATMADTAIFAETAETAASAITAGSVAWVDIAEMPSGFADGIDDVGSGGETYSAGAGIDITGTEISVDDGGITPPMLSDMGAEHDQVLKFDASDGSWNPSDDETGSGGGTSYTAGAGIDIFGDEISIADDGITNDMLSGMGALPGQVLKFDPVDGWVAQDDETASSGSGLTEVATTASLTGDGTSGAPLDIADGGIGLGHIDESGSSDGQVIKNVGGSLVWASDAGGEGSADDDWTIVGDHLRSIPSGSVMIGTVATEGGKLAVATEDNPYTLVLNNTYSTYGSGSIFAKDENNNDYSHGIISKSYYYGSEDYSATAFKGTADADSIEGLGSAYGANLIARSSSDAYGASTRATSVNGISYGISTTANGESTNYGIYAEAYGGTENWAGYFLGDVNITGDLHIAGTLDIAGSLPGDDWGDDFVHTDYTLTGDGTSGDVLGIAEDAIQPDHIDPSAGSDGDFLKINAGNVVWAAGGGSGADSDWEIDGDDLIMTPSGNIGIGTAMPDGKLHISHVGHDFDEATIRISHAAADSYSTIVFEDEGVDMAAIAVGGMTMGGSMFIGTKTWTQLSLKTDDLLRMTVTQDGNVGIGTSAPGELLDVNGNVHISGDLTIDGTYPGGGGGIGGSGTDNYIARWDGSGDLEASEILANDDGSIEIETATSGGYVAQFKNTASGIKSGIWAEGTGGIGIYAKTAADNTSYAALKGVAEGGAPALHARAGTGRAGYFDGDAHVEGKLTSEHHTSPAGPIAYGVISPDGSVASATSNVTCSKVGEIYLITVDGESIHYRDYVIVANSHPDTDRMVTVNSGGGEARIEIYDVSEGTTVESGFSFVIYKP